MTLAELFPDDDYKFQLRFERGEPADFFAPTSQNEKLLVERRHWLRSAPEMYAALLPEGQSLLMEAIEFAQSWNGFLPPATASAPGTPASGPAQTKNFRQRAGSETGAPSVAAREKCLALGEFWEADFLLLKPDVDGEIRLYGGCLCFPSSWRLSDKMGHPIEFIHGPVPGLNASIGPAIHKFLAGLKPGVASLRHNWGLSRSVELNHHPDRGVPRLDASVSESEVWLRVEHQALVALPQSGGILFGIRIVNYPLAEVRKDSTVAARLCRALETMPEAMARYKNLAGARQRIVQFLQD